MTECLPINIHDLGLLKPGEVLISKTSEYLSNSYGVSDCVRSACFQNLGNFSKFVYDLRTSKRKSWRFSSDLSTTWYSDYMTSPAWQKILKCSIFEANITMRACRGFLPLQRTTLVEMRCNFGGYECVDRSDQGDCSGREMNSQDVRLNINIPNILCLCSLHLIFF